MFSGVRVVAGALGNLPSVLDSDELGEALGGLEDVVPSEGGCENRDGSSSSSSSCEDDDDDTKVLSLCCE